METKKSDVSQNARKDPKMTRNQKNVWRNAMLVSCAFAAVPWDTFYTMENVLKWQNAQQIRDLVNLDDQTALEQDQSALKEDQIALKEDQIVLKEDQIALKEDQIAKQQIVLRERPSQYQKTVIFAKILMCKCISTVAQTRKFDVSQNARKDLEMTKDQKNVWRNALMVSCAFVIVQRDTYYEMECV